MHAEQSPVNVTTGDQIWTWIKDSSHKSLNIGENSFNKEQEVESFIPVSSGYLYYIHGQRGGEMEENATSQDGGDKMLSISISKLNKLYVDYIFQLISCM